MDLVYEPMYITGVILFARYDQLPNIILKGKDVVTFYISEKGDVNKLFTVALYGLIEFNKCKDMPISDDMHYIDVKNSKLVFESYHTFIKDYKEAGGNFSLKIYTSKYTDYYEFPYRNTIDIIIGSKKYILRTNYDNIDENIVHNFIEKLVNTKHLYNLFAIDFNIFDLNVYLNSENIDLKGFYYIFYKN